MVDNFVLKIDVESVKGIKKVFSDFLIYEKDGYNKVRRSFAAIFPSRTLTGSMQFGFT